MTTLGVLTPEIAISILQQEIERLRTRVSDLEAILRGEDPYEDARAEWDAITREGE